jgi:hypothetical protein
MMPTTNLASRILAGVMFAAACVTPCAGEADEHLGTVSFPVSCSAEVQSDFNRGVALLHDFWYEEARPQFERILKADPSCAMAHWGIALSGFHQIWDQPDDAGMSAGWFQMQLARSPAPQTERERAYLGAISDFYRPGKATFLARIDAYAASMAKLYADYPQDVDAGAFYALALLAAVRPNDTSLSQERKALAVLTPLWARYPDHPGLLHYIIHACDSPALAADGLAAARHYGEIAFSGPHSVHMPGHIYARLGMWQEDIDSNRASVKASHDAEARHENGWMDQFHSDEFLLYAYLQSGQDAKAHEVIADTAAAMAHYQSMPDMGADQYMVGMFPNYQAELPIFFALEMRDWKSVTALKPIAGAPAETQTQTYWARTIADGHLHQALQARSDLAAYDVLIRQMKATRHAYYAASTEAQIRRGEMLAWVAFAQGDVAAATKQMRVSADLQDKVGQQEVDIPAREMLGDMLLESAKPQMALAEYRLAMTVSPNRFNGLFYAGRAAEAAGDAVAARGYYAALLKSTDEGSQSSRPETAHAKAFVASASAMTR